MATREFRLPDPGEGLVEADIVTWRVAVGDTVQVNDIVVEVETSKSLVELPSPYAGRVTELLVAEGDTVDVGAPIIRIDDAVTAGDDGDHPPEVRAGDGQAEELVPPLPEPEAPAAGERVPVLVGYGPRTGTATRRPRKAPPAERTEGTTAGLAATFSTAAPVSRRTDHRESLPAHRPEPRGRSLPGPGVLPEPADGSAATVLAKPPVRKLAKDLGVDLTALTGSGPGGVVTRDDVQAAAAAPGPRSREPADGPAGETRVPIRGVRKATAEAMVASAFSAPHVSVWRTCDVTATMDLLERLRTRREFAETKISPLLLVAKAVCLALRRTPELHSRWDGAAGEIVLRDEVNLGIAAATPRGLVVPNIKGADRLSLVELATAIGDLVATARAGRTSPADQAGGSFTITNIGVFGVDAGTPILNPGEAGILCVGAIERRPWVVGSGAEERIVPRWVTTLTVSFDHRLADGEQGSRFLADVAGLLTDPGLALLY